MRIYMFSFENLENVKENYEEWESIRYDYIRKVS